MGAGAGGGRGKGGGVDEEEGVWMRHKGYQEEGHVFPRGVSFSDGAHGQPGGQLALGTCDWRELAVSAAGVFIPELEQGGVLEVEASNRSELQTGQTRQVLNECV